MEFKISTRFQSIEFHFVCLALYKSASFLFVCVFNDQEKFLFGTQSPISSNTYYIYTNKLWWRMANSFLSTQTKLKYFLRVDTYLYQNSFQTFTVCRLEQFFKSFSAHLSLKLFCLPLFWKITNTYKNKGIHR